MTEGPLLWYVNRATGVALLVLLTLSVVLGVVAASSRHGRGVPRFVTQSLHRDVALLSLVALAAHVTSAVVDTYVDIRWWQAFVPVGATYEPVWLGVGTGALDLLAVIVVTSLLRTRLGHRTWRVIHALAWPAWALAVIHGVGIGTDYGTRDGLAVAPTAVCVAAVLLALLLRVRPATADQTRPPARSDAA